MKVVTIVGNRPQFIKAAPLSLALRATRVEEIALHTGQHYDTVMSQIFYEELELAEPTHALDLRTASVDAMRPPIVAVLQQERPDWVIVFGDTNTTLAGARAGRELGLKIAHVEAGLRSYDLSMPEERNRIEVDRISQLLFCPDERSQAILVAEGVPGKIKVVGDVMADASRLFAPIARERVASSRAPRSYLLATIHREANVSQPRIGRLVDGLNRLTEPIVFPVHPRTHAALTDAGLRLESHIEVTPPVGYLELTALASQARVIITDSGGLQKEAYWYGVPCVTMRPSTEWTDTVATGANVLVDADADALVDAVRTASMPAKRPQLYGDGHASELVAQALLCTIPRR